MTDQCLVARRPDPDDGRRVLIALTDLARSAMKRRAVHACEVIGSCVSMVGGDGIEPPTRSV
jgi:DNA-binding MarR family transcriptional regulator